LPATAFGYVVTAFLSRFFLHETVSPWRWAGVLLITCGVGLVARGPSLTERRTTEHRAKDATLAKESVLGKDATLAKDSAVSPAKEQHELA
jgi:drug/metabolite transporter (DMT)-like permease